MTKRLVKDWLVVGATAAFLAAFIAGCAPKVDTRFQAPPPGANARPDPPNPDKAKQLPAGDRPGR